VHPLAHMTSVGLRRTRLTLSVGHLVHLLSIKRPHLAYRKEQHAEPPKSGGGASRSSGWVGRGPTIRDNCHELFLRGVTRNPRLLGAYY